MVVRGTERSKKKTKNKPSIKPPSRIHDIASFPTRCPSVANCAQGKQQGAKAGYKPTGKKIISTPSQSQDSHFVPCRLSIMYYKSSNAVLDSIKATDMQKCEEASMSLLNS